MSTEGSVILIAKSDRDADLRLIAGLREEVVRLTAERDALRQQLAPIRAVTPGYQVVQHPTRPLFLEPTHIADAHTDYDEDDQ